MMATNYEKFCDGCGLKEGKGVFNPIFEHVVYGSKWYDICPNCMGKMIKLLLSLKESK